MRKEKEPGITWGGAGFFRFGINTLFGLIGIREDGDNQKYYWHSAMSEEAAILAGRIFRNYRKQGGPRTTILPDFFVAAHAAIQAGALATVDRGYLRAYFPKVRLLFPELP